jgi:hypothetical protein
MTQQELFLALENEFSFGLEAKSYHPWEVQGYIAPYSLTDVVKMPSTVLQERDPAAYNRIIAMMPPYVTGSCAVCGNGIKLHFVIRDAVGELFSVGSSCVEKTELKKAAKKANRVRLQRKRNDRQQRGVQHSIARDVAAKHNAKRSIQEIIHPIKDLIQALSDGKGNFRKDIARSLRQGEPVYGNALEITLNILTKETGLKKSEIESRLLPVIDELSNLD